MKKHGFPTLLAAMISMAFACGDDGSATPGDTGSTTDDPTTAGSMTTMPPTSGPTSEGPTSGEPGTSGSGTEGTATADATSDDGTASDGTATGSTGGTADDSGTGSGSESGSSSEGSSSGGALPNCDAGDGPDFTVTNNGLSDYVIDGVNDPDLTVVRGCSYTFTINAVGHPFLIKTVQSAGLTNTYDDGVTNQGAQNGMLTWDVPLDAPNTLFYDCQFHAAMTGTINVIDG